MAGWLAGWLASWVTGWVAVAAWLGGWVTVWLPDWLAGWVGVLRVAVLTASVSGLLRLMYGLAPSRQSLLQFSAIRAAIRSELHCGFHLRIVSAHPAATHQGCCCAQQPLLLCMLTIHSSTSHLSTVCCPSVPLMLPICPPHVAHLSTIRDLVLVASQLTKLLA